MRIALVGWDLAEAPIRALTGLGAEVVALTRWHDGQAFQEDRGGWIQERCPHRLGDGRCGEAWAFRESVLSRVVERGWGSEGFDVIHALDAMAGPAARGLAEQDPGGVWVASVTQSEVEPGVEPAPALVPDRSPVCDRPPACWICDHPCTAERWRGRGVDGPLAVVPTLEMVAGGNVGPMTPVGLEPDTPLMVVWAPREAEIDPLGIARALAEARGAVPKLTAVVLGTGPGARALRRRLAERGVLLRSAPLDCDASPARWRTWLGAAAVVGVPARNSVDDPTAWAAWLLGVPVVRLASDPGSLCLAISDALFAREAQARCLRAGAVLARRRLEPAGVAQGWMRVYLEARLRPPADGHRPVEPPALPGIPSGRSRLCLVPIGPRQVYASWHVRPDDWATALEWLGPDAVRASLALRFFDVTDIHFNGTNAHALWDVELGPDKTYRALGLPFPGRSLAASLGLRSPRGHFHPLAHARLAHLPREELAPDAPIRLLHALPRR